MDHQLGHRLSMARHALQLSQKTVAGAAGITQKHLSQVENDDEKLRRLGCGTLAKLADQLGVSTDYLLGRHDALSP